MSVQPMLIVLLSYVDSIEVDGAINATRASMWNRVPTRVMGRSTL